MTAQPPERPPPSVDADISATLAANLARHRSARGWSLAKLAEASGVSRAMLNQIERCQSVPTISVLWKIATALEMPFAALLAQSAPVSTTVIKRGRSWSLMSQDGAFLSRALFPMGGRRQAEFYELKLAPHVEEVAEAHPEGTTENLVVNRGTVEVAVGDETFRLEEGDAIEFRADVRHSYRNPLDSLAVVYLVMTYAMGSPGIGP